MKKEEEGKLCKRKEGMTDKGKKQNGWRMKEERNKWSKELKMVKVRKAKLHKIMEGMPNRNIGRKKGMKKARTDRNGKIGNKKVRSKKKDKGKGERMKEGNENLRKE